MVVQAQKNSRVSILPSHAKSHTPEFHMSILRHWWGLVLQSRHRHVGNRPKVLSGRKCSIHSGAGGRLLFKMHLLEAQKAVLKWREEQQQQQQQHQQQQQQAKKENNKTKKNGQASS